ncbi:MAG: class I SAM-dependent methyltransferase [Deltaproteobacteria bacterium]|nr:class I SAM-dependent methyltransferase [Deltaproteobacteria bacterium]
MSRTNDDHVVYRERAELYDLIYSAKDYVAEAVRIRELLEDEGIGQGAWITEAACGTGKHLEQLRQWYRVSGFDLAEPMLRIARARLPAVQLFRADMADFEVEEPADGILCLFSSIGYLLSTDALDAAAQCFHRALRTGGVLIVEPFVDPESFEEGRPHLDTYDDDDIKLARTIVTRAEGLSAILDFHWLVARRGEPVEHFVEHHELRLHRRDELEATFEQVGFDTRWVEPGLIPARGLLLGCKR